MYKSLDELIDRNPVIINLLQGFTGYAPEFKINCTGFGNIAALQGVDNNGLTNNIAGCNMKQKMHR